MRYAVPRRVSRVIRMRRFPVASSRTGQRGPPCLRTIKFTASAEDCSCYFSPLLARAFANQFPPSLLLLKISSRWARSPIYSWKKKLRIEKRVIKYYDLFRKKTFYSHILSPSLEEANSSLPSFFPDPHTWRYQALWTDHPRICVSRPRWNH